MVYCLRVTSFEYENLFLPRFWWWLFPSPGERQRVSKHWMHWTRYRKKLLSIERACSIDEENYNARNFCWWIPCFCQLQNRQEERARTQSAARKQGMAARARQRRLMCGSWAAGLLIVKFILNRWNNIIGHKCLNY